MPTSQSNYLLAKIFKGTGTLALAAVAIALPACTIPTEPEATTPEAVEENVELDENVTTESLTGNVEDYIGETVTVREEVNEVVGQYAFSLEGGELFGGEAILVINDSQRGLELVEGDDTHVQVTGEVREFIQADFETEYGFELESTLFGEYEQQPVIIAQSLALSPDPQEITENPEQYYNKRIALNGEVGTVWDANVITIDDEALFGGEELLVINPQAEVVTQENEEVVITGTLRPFIFAEFERDYSLTWDLDTQQQIEAEYENQPVFVADEVYPSAI